MVAVAIKPGAAAAAIRKDAAKLTVPSAMRTADWAEVPVQLRERAFFSAGVESTRFLSEAQRLVRAKVGMQQELLDNGKTAYVTRSSIVRDLRKLALGEGLAAADGSPADLTNLASRARLGLFVEMLERQAAGYANWKAGQDATLLEAYPAQELVRIASRRAPRDWESRWAEAGGELSDGRMVALKNDSIWSDISRFGTPWPPFDFGSGMGLRSIDRTEAEELGLLAPGEKQAPEATPFNDSLEAPLQGVDPEIADVAAQLFGDLVEVAGGVLRWVGGKS
jgi:hypothetical protein